MLKVFLGFLVSAAVLLASMYAPFLGRGVHAISTSILITHIQAGGVGAATQEFVVLYNNSAEEIDITGWCLTNKTGATIACFAPPLTGQAIYLPAHQYAVIVSNTFLATLPVGSIATVYTPTNQSSGSITGSSDTISLLDHTGQVVDSHNWTSPLSAGMHFERHVADIPEQYIDTDGNGDWSVTQANPLPVDGTEIDTTIADICPNIQGIQSGLTNEQELNGIGECIDKPIALILITELLPNAIGTDVGNEFVELYNPNEWSVQLSDYKLYIGPDFNDGFEFPAGSSLDSHSYKSFSNSEIPFSLLNSSSRVSVVSKTGSVVSQSPAYGDPEDGQSWGVINEVWQYMNKPTPGAENLVMDMSLVAEQVSTLQQCAMNQYRSPETNRCRLLSSMVSAVTPCKDGQYRSEETNRCRNIATDAKVVTPCDEGEERNIETNRCRKVVAVSQPALCKEGQERNPDTNRCRTVTKMPNAEYRVLGAKTENGGSGYILAAIAGVLIVASGYAVWEWHEEIGNLYRKCRRKIIRFARIHK